MSAGKHELFRVAVSHMPLLLSTHSKIESEWGFETEIIMSTPIKTFWADGKQFPLALTIIWSTIGLKSLHIDK